MALFNREPSEEEDEQLMIALAMSSETFKEEERLSSDPLERFRHSIVLETSYPKKSIPHFRLNSSSKFVLKTFRSGTPNGEIHFRPLDTFHPKFVQELGEFCYNSPQKFFCSISEVFNQCQSINLDVYLFKLFFFRQNQKNLSCCQYLTHIFSLLFPV